MGKVKVAPPHPQVSTVPVTAAATAAAGTFILYRGGGGHTHHRGTSLVAERRHFSEYRPAEGPGPCTPAGPPDTWVPGGPRSPL